MFRTKSAVVILSLAFVAFMSCGNPEKPQPTPAAPSVTGAWTTAVTTGGGAGGVGMLITQSDTTVTGSVGGRMPLTGRFVNGHLTASGTMDGAPWTVDGTLSTNGSVLSTTFSYRGETTSLTWNKVSSTPAIPDQATPEVTTITPADGTAGVETAELVVQVRWSKPVTGWDCVLEGPINGQAASISGDDLIDPGLSTWDPATRTYSLHLRPTLDPNSAYTLRLDSGDEVDWNDAFGIPAWTTTAGCDTIRFTTLANPGGPYECADLQGVWESHSLAADGSGDIGWQRGRNTFDGACGFQRSWTDQNGNSGESSGTFALSPDGIWNGPGGDQGAIDTDKTVSVSTATLDGKSVIGSAALGVAVRTGGSYSDADLAGTWEIHYLAATPGAPWWQRIRFEIAPDLTFTGSREDIEGHNDTISGTFAGISSEGIISGGPDASRGAMDAGKTVMVGTATWSTGHPGTGEMSVGVKVGGSYSLADLEGKWEFHAISSGSGAWWQRSSVTIGSDGSFTAHATENDGDTDTITGQFVISPDGLIQFQRDTSFRAVMDAGKSVVVATSTQGNGSSSMWVWVKMRQ